MNKTVLIVAAMALVVTGFLPNAAKAVQAAGNAASPIRLQNTELKIAVTPPQFDDIGSVLTNMGWNYTEINSGDLKDASLLSQFDVIFINCSYEATAYGGNPDLGSEEAAASLEQFVREGGTLYASDFAYIYIHNAFPGYIDFYDDPFGTGSSSADEYVSGPVQTLTADILDAGMAGFLNNPTVELVFNAVSWVIIQSVPETVNVYAAGDITQYDGSILEDNPLSASFAYGEGRVVFTSYHNEAQASEEEKKALEYLVFVTSTKELSADLQEGMTATGHGSQQELLGAINAGDSSALYPFGIPSNTDLAIGLNWQAGTLKLSVFKPDGSLAAQEEGPAPLIIQIPGAEAGEWSYQVEALGVPYDNYPYVVQISVPAFIAPTESPTAEVAQAAPSAQAVADNPADSSDAQAGSSPVLYVVIGVAVLAGVAVFVMRKRKA